MPKLPPLAETLIVIGSIALTLWFTQPTLL